jgi:hypothetical protein
LTLHLRSVELCVSDLFFIVLSELRVFARVAPKPSFE